MWHLGRAVETVKYGSQEGKSCHKTSRGINQYVDLVGQGQGQGQGQGPQIMGTVTVVYCSIVWFHVDTPIGKK